MNSKDRFYAAVDYRVPDRLPTKHYGTPEVNQMRMEHFGISTYPELQLKVGDDFRHVEPRYIGPELRIIDELFDVDEARDEHGVDSLQGLDTATGAYAGLSGDGVQVGIMDSGVDDDHHDFDGRLVRLFAPLYSRAALTPEQGAETVVFLATSPEVEDITGGYFIKNKAVSPRRPRSLRAGTARG